MIKPEIATGFRQMILNRIPMSKQEPADQQAILAMPFRDLLSTFYNWQNRRVSIRPRAVHISQALRAKNRNEVVVLADKIKKGEDLNPHLNERVETVFLATPKDPGLRYREDLDLLLTNGLFITFTFPRFFRRTDLLNGEESSCSPRLGTMMPT